MAGDSRPSARPGRLDPLILPRVVIWALLAGVLSYTEADPDLWGHVRFGLDMLDSRSLSRVDPYSFTSDQSWANHEWLAELAMAAVYRALGPAGLALLKLGLLAVAFWMIARELASRGVPRVARDLLLVFAVVCAVGATRTVRPQVFSLLLFTCLLIVVRRVEDGRGRLAWLAAPIMLVWANLHGGWLVGIAVLGLWSGVRVVVPRGASRRVWAASSVAGLVATLATPDGYGLWLFLGRTVGLRRSDIAEWQPLTQTPLLDVIPFALAAIVALMAVARAPERRATHVATVLLLAFVSFRVVRVTPFFGVAVALLMGPHLAHRTVAASPPPAPPLAAGVVTAFAVLVLAAAGAALYRGAACIRMGGLWMVDQRAAAFLMHPSIDGRLLTWFDWGEYAIWFLAPRLRVSMDGRRETVYSDEVLRRHDALYRGLPGWQDGLQLMNPEHIWLPNRIPTLPEIETLGWRPIFRTEQSTVLSRAAETPADAPTPSLAPCFPGEP